MKIPSQIDKYLYFHFIVLLLSVLLQFESVTASSGDVTLPSSNNVSTTSTEPNNDAVNTCSERKRNRKANPDL